MTITSWESEGKNHKFPRWNDKTDCFSLSNPDIDSKCREVTAKMQGNIKTMLGKRLLYDEDKKLVANYLLACMRHENATIGTRRFYIIATTYLSEHCSKHGGFRKRFMEMDEDDIESFLDSFRPKEGGKNLSQKEE